MSDHEEEHRLDDISNWCRYVEDHNGNGTKLPELSEEEKMKQEEILLETQNDKNNNIYYLIPIIKKDRLKNKFFFNICNVTLALFLFTVLISYWNDIFNKVFDICFGNLWYSISFSGGGYISEQRINNINNIHNMLCLSTFLLIIFIYSLSIFLFNRLSKKLR